jgi:murein L,D-transpeptidase YafK
MLSLVLLAAINQPQQATRIVIKKSEHTLTVYHNQTKLRDYKVSLGSGSGAKQQAGDRKTPEGSYLVDRKIEQSQFHHAFHLSYPNPQDRERAQKLHEDPGGDIEIHGQKNSLGWLGSLTKRFDWTAGCIALTNDEIDAIWAIVPVGTPVEIDR